MIAAPKSASVSVMAARIYVNEIAEIGLLTLISKENDADLSEVAMMSIHAANVFSKCLAAENMPEAPSEAELERPAKRANPLKRPKTKDS